jgi:hypothetical protein
MMRRRSSETTRRYSREPVRDITGEARRDDHSGLSPRHRNRDFSMHRPMTDMPRVSSHTAESRQEDFMIAFSGADE